MPRRDQRGAMTLVKVRARSVACSRSFNPALAEKIHLCDDLSLCNFHTWLLARAAPAKGAAAFCLKLLEGLKIARYKGRASGL